MIIDPIMKVIFYKRNHQGPRKSRCEKLLPRAFSVSQMAVSGQPTPLSLPQLIDNGLK
jgi:hypothetical protein